MLNVNDIKLLKRRHAFLATLTYNTIFVCDCCLSELCIPNKEFDMNGVPSNNHGWTLPQLIKAAPDGKIYGKMYEIPASSAISLCPNCQKDE